MAEWSLSALDVTRYEVFTVTSKLFWRTKLHLTRLFFDHLQSIGSTGFIATADASICASVSAAYGVACVVSKHYKNDPALSKERWHIILSILRRKKSIMYAGLDVRFLQPVHSWYAASINVDAAFEGYTSSVRGKDGHRVRVTLFTPDLVLARPTERSIAFFERLVEVIRARSLDGLPQFLQDRTLLRFNLMGPAEQELLRDELLTALHNRTVVTRKYGLARGAAATMEGTFLAGQMVSRSTLPRCDARSLKIHHNWRNDACRGSGVVSDFDLPPLHAMRHEHGTRIVTPLLTVLLSDGVGMRSGKWPCRPDRCGKMLVDNKTLAVHCLDKQPKCLNITNCRLRLERHRAEQGTSWTAIQRAGHLPVRCHLTDTA